MTTLVSCKQLILNSGVELFSSWFPLWINLIFQSFHGIMCLQSIIIFNQKKMIFNMNFNCCCIALLVNFLVWIGIVSELCWTIDYALIVCILIDRWPKIINSSSSFCHLFLLSSTLSLTSKPHNCCPLIDNFNFKCNWSLLKVSTWGCCCLIVNSQSLNDGAIVWEFFLNCFVNDISYSYGDTIMCLILFFGRYSGYLIWSYLCLVF